MRLGISQKNTPFIKAKAIIKKKQTKKQKNKKKKKPNFKL